MEEVKILVSIDKNAHKKLKKEAIDSEVTLKDIVGEIFKIGFSEFYKTKNNNKVKARGERT